MLPTALRIFPVWLLGIFPVWLLGIFPVWLLGIFPVWPPTHFSRMAPWAFLLYGPWALKGHDLQSKSGTPRQNEHTGHIVTIIQIYWIHPAHPHREFITPVIRRDGAPISDSGILRNSNFGHKGLSDVRSLREIARCDKCSIPSAIDFPSTESHYGPLLQPVPDQNLVPVLRFGLKV